MPTRSKRVYQWVIDKDSEGFYTLNGFVCDGSSKDRDGAPAVWSYIEGILEHIRKQEASKLKVNDNA